MIQNPPRRLALKCVALAVAAAAARSGVIYVNLFRERQHDPFVRDPSLHASDGLHPSDRGYAVWWQALQAQAQAGLPARLQAAR